MKKNFTPVYLLFIISMLCLTSMPLSAQTTYYVKQGGAGTGDGSSWVNASGNLQDMLNNVLASGPVGGNIWVAAGTYYGSFSWISDPLFPVPPLTLLGGFPSTGNPGIGDRNPTMNPTILSGDAGMDDLYTNGLVQSAGDIVGSNVRVMEIQRAGNAMTIDGFIFNAGSIGGGDDYNRGGGLSIRSAGGGNHSTPVISNCKFIGNYCGDFGGGVYGYAGVQSPIVGPKFFNCVFSGNRAGNGGGGLNLETGGGFSQLHLTVVNTTFTNNEALGSNAGEGGGAIRMFYLESGETGYINIFNSSFTANTATLDGGGLLISGQGGNTHAKLTNCQISGNVATNGKGGGLFFGRTLSSGGYFRADVTNTTFSGNRAGSDGGGVYNLMTSSGVDFQFKLTNTISWNNQDVTGTGTAGSSFSYPAGANNVINYSLLQGQNPAGTGNLNGTLPANDPDFVSSLPPANAPSSSGNFRLLTSSPALNVGNNASVPQDTFDVDMDMNVTEPAPDLDTQDRIESTTVDLGSFEGAVTVCTPPVVNAPTVTQPTCQTPTGTIVVNATGGTLEYSVNNGSSWQASSTFSGLAAGNYNIKVRLQSDPNCMTAYASNPVVLNAPTGCCPAGTIIYVNDNAGGANNGTSWTDAYTDLQNAIAEANTCPNITQIWVAEGIYKPTPGTDRTISFVMKNDLAIYGGFAGTEAALGDRPNPLMETTLSGDIGVGGDNTDNSYHVIRNSNLNNTAVLDGFYVTGGNANGTGEYVFGGGVYNINASPSFLGCTFLLNNALEGGGMYNANNSSPGISRCAFSSNNATLYNGGGMVNSNGSSPVIVNTIFVENNAANLGGTMFNTGNCNPDLMNCTLTANSASTAGGLYSQFTSTPTVTNSICWNNAGGTSFGLTTFSYSLLQEAACPVGASCNMGMIYNTDPLFVGLTDSHLQSCSPAKNVGTATGAPVTDYDGDARPLGSGIDMGIDENGAVCCPGGNILYVNDDAAGANNGTSWANAFNSLQDALAAQANCPGVTQIWVAVGNYKPTTGTDRTISFNLKNNLAIYGGFIGTETMLSERNWLSNVTNLSGDIGVPGDNTDNSYHVVRNENINNTAILDGFRILYGNANGTGEYLWGGGIFNINNASPTIKQCGIIENNALEGGGMANRTNSSPSIINCGISFNHAITYKGGGIYNETNSSPVIVNTNFRGNTAAEVGGAIYNVGNCNSELMNCTLVANSANTGAGIASFISNPVVTNSIFWNNTGGTALGTSITFSYSLLQDATCPAGHTCGAGMIYNIDPLFVSPTDAHLQPCSPAKNVGTSTGAPATDLEGDARPLGTGIDMGMDESTTACNCPENRTLSGILPTDTYNADMNLTANALVKNGIAVTFKAGTSITLEANFEVQLGGVFEALIEGCSPVAPPSPPGMEKQ